LVSAPSRRRGASARQQSGSRAQTTPVAAALTPSASTSAALVPCGIRALRFAAVETSPDGSPPRWCRGDLASWHPRKGAETANGARSRPRGLHRVSGASLRSTLPWLRPRPLPVAVALKSNRPKALRLGVRPPKRPNEEGQAFRHPSPKRRMSSVASPPLPDETPRTTHEERHGHAGSSRGAVPAH
jgi:hypothetical protein